MRAAVVAAILLAAGESTRMGRPKPLLPWMGTTLVAYQLEQLTLAGADPVIVVLGHEADRVATALAVRQSILVRNPDYALGKSTSIRAGIEALPEEADALLIQGVDQPRRAETVSTLISAHLAGRHPITVPTYLGRRGHPPLLSPSLRDEIRAIDDAHQGLREVMSRHRQETGTVPMETPEVLLDLNTPEDYHRALAFFGAHGPDCANDPSPDN